jgi:hypothetical protein
LNSRRLTTLLLIALLALVAGCGGGDDGSGDKAPLGDSLAYFPKNAPLVGTLDTDVDGEQYKNLDKLLSKFPFGGQVKNQIRQGIDQQGANYEKDVKPLLGGDLVLGATDAKALTDDAQPDRFVFVFKASGGKLQETVAKDTSYKEAGELEGGKLYESSNDRSVVVVKDDTMVGAENRGALQAAFDRHDGDDNLTEDDFNGAFQDLPQEPLMRIYGDAQALLQSDPRTSEAMKVKWVAGLRKFGIAVNVEGDGFAIDSRVNTEGLTPEDLPIAAGDQAPALARFSDFSYAQRDISQSWKFIVDAAAATDAEGFEDYETKKERANKDLGIDIDRDFIGQFTGDTSVTGGLNGTFAVRSSVKDPAAMKTTVEKLGKSGGTGDLKLSPAGDLVLADDGEDRVFFGMVDDAFVAGPTPDAAKQIATVEPKPVGGAKGSMTFVADGEAIAKAILQRSGRQGGAAGLFTGRPSGAGRAAGRSRARRRTTRRPRSRSAGAARSTCRWSPRRPGARPSPPAGPDARGSSPRAGA